MSTILPKTAQRREELIEIISKIDESIAANTHLKAVFSAELAGIYFALSEATAAPVAEPQAEKPARAKKGEMETAIRYVLEERPEPFDEICKIMRNTKPESVRAVLRRLVALGKIRQDGDTYRLPTEAERNGEAA